MQLDKFSVCVLPTQCGKTFVAIDHILKKLEIDPNGLHVVYTMNTLLNNAQFANRLRTIEEQYGNGSVVIFASKYQGVYNHVKTLEELKERTRVIPPRVVVMCSHHKRFEQGHSWVEQIGEYHPDIKVHMVYDELHQYISKSLRQMLVRMHALPYVESIMALTATPKAIIHKRGLWSNLKLVAHESFSMDNYTRLHDMVSHPVNDFFPEGYTKPQFNDFERMDEETIGFMEKVLDDYPEILAPGNRVFLPAHVRRQGHVTVRDIVLERNPEAVVVLLNAKDKVMVYEEAGTFHKISLVSAEKEVCEHLADQLVMRGLLDRTLVITGFLCVGMGQTLTHPIYGNMTHAVISHMNVNNDAIYQLFGRLTGRVKRWEHYQPTHVYAPQTIFNRVKVMEECAVRVWNELLLTQPIYQKPMYDMPEGVDVRENERTMRLQDGRVVMQEVE